MTQEEKKKRIKKVLIYLLILAAILGGIFFVVKKLSKEVVAPEREIKEELSVLLEQESVSDELEFFGNLAANKEADLSAKTSGRISSIRVDEGVAVRRGEFLAYLAPDQFGIDYKKKSDNFINFEKYRKDQESYWDKQVKIAEENLDTKEEELDYYRANDPARVDIAEEAVDKAEDELRSAKRQRDAQDESLKEQSDNANADKDLAAQYVFDTRINAPFASVVTKKYLEMGEVVAAGQPVIAIADISSVKVVIEVPDSLVSRLSIGLGARVMLDGIPGEYAAKVTAINPKVDPVAKKMEVDVTLDSVPQNVKLDVFARVFIKFPERTAYFVPNNFVYSGFTGPFVIIDDGTQRLVERIGERDGKTEIAFEGITNGMKIIRKSDGAQQ